MKNDEEGCLVMETAVEAGHIMLENGAEIFRVEETVDRICRHYGVESCSYFVLSNGILATMGSKKEKAYARVMHIPVHAARLDKVCAVNQLSREISEGRYTIEQVQEKLADIRTMKGKSNHMRILAAGIGSGCFCYILGGSLRDCAASCLSGLILYAFLLFVARDRLSKLMTNIFGGALVTLCCLLFYSIHLGENLNFCIIGAVMPLVPGVAFTNGIRDLADEDYISGSVRLLDAIMGFICIAIGVGIVFLLYQRMFGGGML